MNVKYIDKLYNEIVQIKKCMMDDNNDLNDILDSYEIDKKCYYFIENSDHTYFQMFRDLLKVYFKETKNIVQALDKIKLYNKDNQHFRSFLLYVNDYFDFCNNKFIIKNDDVNDEDDEEDDEEYEDYIDENVVKPKDIIKLRYNQEIARVNNKKNNFNSGIHCQVTGAGKSLLIMMTVNDHYSTSTKKNKGRLYIITCPRIEVLNAMFFVLDKNSDKFIINPDTKKFWKDNNIIDLDEFKIFDRVNYSSQNGKLKLAQDKPNILIVNSDTFKSMDSNNFIDYSKLNFVLFDECHSVSATRSEERV
jgi:hypothetical protein